MPLMGILSFFFNYDENSEVSDLLLLLCITRLSTGLNFYQAISHESE